MLVELQVIILCLFTLHLLIPFTWSKTFDIEDEGESLILFSINYRLLRDLSLSKHVDLMLKHAGNTNYHNTIAKPKERREKSRIIKGEIKKNECCYYGQMTKRQKQKD